MEEMFWFGFACGAGALTVLLGAIMVIGLIIKTAGRDNGAGKK
ncbi:MAG: hypothetical protein V1701_02515 [Planctomycetota bacterium]